jgi:hypothetical protein
MGCYKPPPPKRNLIPRFAEGGGSKEWRNGYDECLHGKIDGKDKLEDTEKALQNLDIPIDR